MHGTPPTKELQSKLEILNGEMTSIYDSNYDFSFPFLATEPWMFVISSNSTPYFEVLVLTQEMYINILSFHKFIWKLYFLLWLSRSTNLFKN